MTRCRNALAAALLGCGALPCPAWAQSTPEFEFGGFGTVAAVHSSEREADFVGNIQQPNGWSKPGLRAPPLRRLPPCSRG